jgi:predicted nucleic acid-binding protein
VSDAYIDTDVLIRFLTGDDLEKQARSAQLFAAIEDGSLTVRAPVTVIADAAHVLASRRLYGLPRAQVAAMLSLLVRHPGFRVDQRSVVLAALSIFAEARLDFGDCMLVASMRQDGVSRLYSYDRDFDRFADIERVEPGAPE